jgi:plastocyanin
VNVATAISLAIITISLSLTYEDANAELVPNQAYLVEGAGFGVTDESIKNSQIDLLIATEKQIGSRIPITVEDGFLTLNDLGYDVSDLSGTLFFEGRLLQITGTVENSIGTKIKVSFLGRLIQHSEQGSVYSFTGKLTEGTQSNKLIYTSKISGLTTDVSGITKPLPTDVKAKEGERIIRIIKGSSSQSFGMGYIEKGEKSTARYFNPDRLTIIPGTTLTFINDDIVSHNVNTGKRDTKRGLGDLIPDGKIASGDIQPGKTWSVTINDVGFIFLFDKDYRWMTMDVVSFPDVLFKDPAKIRLEINLYKL